MIHLRLHNHYSIKRGYGMNYSDNLHTEDPYINKAKELGMTHIALTNYANDHGFVNWWQGCKKAGIQPIFGIEFMVTQDMTTKGRPDFSHINFGNDTLILLAKNNQGYKDLSQVNTIANHDDHYFSYPRIDYDFLDNFDVSNFICILPYDFSTITRMIFEDNVPQARRVIRMLKNKFGTDLYFELSANNSPVNHKINNKIYGLAKQFEIECIASSNVHYPNPENKKTHDVILALGQKKTFAELDLYSLGADDHYLMSQTEIEFGLHESGFNNEEIESFIGNNHKIAAECTFDLTFPEMQIPDPMESGIIPAPFKSNEEYFKHLIQRGWDNKIVPRINSGDWDEIKFSDIHIYESRREYEYKMIKEMFTMKDPNHPAKEGFIPYFLIVRDYVCWAKGIDRRIMHDAPTIAVGPARGSVSGSLIGYLVDLQEVDPIPYTLTFERFINPERVSWPDIDMDFHNEKAWWVEIYLINTYGADHVAHIITFQTMATKMSFDNVSKVLSGKYGTFRTKVKQDLWKSESELNNLLNMTKQEAEELKALMTDEPLSKQLNQESPSFNPLLFEKSQLTAYKELFEIAVSLEGTISSTGSHPGACIITKEPIWNHCSKINNKGKYDNGDILYVTSFEKYNCEEINTMKFDILRLRELVIVENTLEFIKQSLGIDIDLTKINPYDIESNLKILDLLMAGDTDGIFQFSSHLYKGIIEEVLGNLGHMDKNDVAKDLFNIIVALEALGRPGPLEGGMVPRFAEFLAFPERAEKIHPVVDEILAETYSNMLYQEQIMFILMKLGGFSLGQADMVRRGIASGDPIKIEKQREPFMKGVRKVQLEKYPDTSDEEMEKLLILADSIFDLMAKWAGYGFNKAHSVGYGILTHRGAWLKVNYKSPFMAALMSAATPDRIPKYIDEIRSRGIKVLQPRINKAIKGFNVSDNDIIFGLAAINGVGEKAVENITSLYPFDNILDFMQRTDSRSVGRRVIPPLIKAGYFDEDKKFLLKYWEALYEICDSKTRLEESLLNFIVDNGIHDGTYEELSNRIDKIIFEKSTKRRTEKTRNETLSLINNTNYTDIEILGLEKEVLGMYLSENPLSSFQDIIYCTTLQDDFKDHTQKEDLFIVGIISTEPKVILDKNQNEMAFMTLQMWDGMQECVIFHESYKKYKSLYKEGNIIIGKGRKGRAGGGFILNSSADLPEKQNAFREFFKINQGVG